MALFAIADLHLPGPYGESKSMEVFEPRWKKYREKLEKNWRAIVSDNDAVVIPGDVSWAMRMPDALDDLAFINSLPGRKYLGKGNHDFWWTTVSAMRRTFLENGFDTLELLYNNSYVLPECAILGARGWYPDPSNQKTSQATDWQKISDREVQRLRISLSTLPPGTDPGNTILFIHFPPVWAGFVCRGLVDEIKNAGIRRCCFGHIHGFYGAEADFEFEGIRFEMISADRLNFVPKLILPSSDR
ncbi:MAG: metallophosphoesterase [Clostridia bacterium]|nr:metallophosphoesterase [Clostridia bacterium]